jgi:hypothetical protein
VPVGSLVQIPVRWMQVAGRFCFCEMQRIPFSDSLGLFLRFCAAVGSLVQIPIRWVPVAGRVGFCETERIPFPDRLGLFVQKHFRLVYWLLSPE